MTHLTSLFGYFGKHVNITNGRYVYMKYTENADTKLYNYTIMPMHIFTPFSVEELRCTDKMLYDGLNLQRVLVL